MLGIPLISLLADAGQRTLTQDEVLRSISDNVSGSSGAPAQLLAGLLAMASIAVGVAVWIQWHRRNHPEGKLDDPSRLVHELSRELHLSRSQVRHLNALRQDLGERGIAVTNPLTLLLCPSLVQKACEESGATPRTSPEEAATETSAEPPQPKTREAGSL